MNEGDKLQEMLDLAFNATCEAESLAYAGGMRTMPGQSLVKAHSALLAAKNEYAAMQRTRAEQFNQ